MRWVIPVVLVFLFGTLQAGEPRKKIFEQRHLYYAAELERKGCLTLSVEAYEDFLRRHPDHARAGQLTLKIAQMQFRAGKLDASIRASRRYMALYSYEDEAIEAEYWLGRALYALGDYGAARRQFRAARSRQGKSASPFFVHSSYMEGLCHLDSGRFEEASAVLRKVAALYAGLTVGCCAELALGDCFMRLGDCKRAREHFTRALELSKDPELIRLARLGLSACSEAGDDHSSASSPGGGAGGGTSPASALRTVPLSSTRGSVIFPCDSNVSSNCRAGSSNASAVSSVFR